MLHAATDGVTTSAMPAGDVPDPVSSSSSFNPFDQYKVIRRNGSVVVFEPAKISIALTKAFIAVNGGQGAASARVREMVEQLTDAVVSALIRRQPHGGTMHIEDIQDQVELELMRSGEHDVARTYVLYREERARSRAKAQPMARASQVINVVDEDGVARPLDLDRLSALVQDACAGLCDAVDANAVIKLTLKDLYDGVARHEVRKCLVLSARSLIEKEPSYNEVLYPGATNPFPWMAEMIDLKKEKNFFETRVTEYQTGGALSWD